MSDVEDEHAAKAGIEAAGAGATSEAEGEGEGGDNDDDDDEPPEPPEPEDEDDDIDDKDYTQIERDADGLPKFKKDPTKKRSTSEGEERPK